MIGFILFHHSWLEESGKFLLIKITTTCLMYNPFRSHLARQNIDIAASPTKTVTCTTAASINGAQKFIINRQKLFAMTK